MRYKYQILLLLSVLAMPTSLCSKSQRATKTFQVTGVVKDLNGAPLVGASVLFASGKSTFSTKTAGDGSYALSLPKSKLEAIIEKEGFCAQRRSISFSGVNTPTLNFTLFDCSDCAPTIIDYDQPAIPLDGSAPNFPKPPDLAFKYLQEEIQISDPSSSRVNIRYGKKTEEQGSMTYEGLICALQKKPIIVTYDWGALQALKLTYFKNEKKMVAQGTVTIVDERGITRASEVEIKPFGESLKLVTIK